MKDTCNIQETYTMFYLKVYIVHVTVKDLSVSLNLTLSKSEKVEHYIRINVHKSIVLRIFNPKP